MCRTSQCRGKAAKEPACHQQPAPTSGCVRPHGKRRPRQRRTDGRTDARSSNPTGQTTRAGARGRACGVSGPADGHVEPRAAACPGGMRRCKDRSHTLHTRSTDLDRFRIAMPRLTDNTVALPAVSRIPPLGKKELSRMSRWISVPW